jgi:hypothetical protein
LGFASETRRAAKADARRIEDGVVAPHRPEHAGQATRDGDDGDALAASL